MLNRIKNLFKKEEFKIVELTTEEIIGNELSNILNQKIAGIVIKNFFLPEEKIEIDFSKFQVRETPFGFTTGLSIFNSKSDLSDYFEENKKYNELIKQTLGSIDYQNKLELIFSKIFYNKKSKIYNSEINKDYKLSTLRVIEPNKEGIQKHIGNEFMFNFSQTKAIRNDAVNTTQFSFFLLLQTPEIGGELILFNKYWKDTPSSLVESGSLVFKRGERTNFLSDSKTLPIKMNKGDLLIFDGGRIWHKVSSVKGTKSRITVGGFLAISKEKDKVFYWS